MKIKNNSYNKKLNIDWQQYHNNFIFLYYIIFFSYLTRSYLYLIFNLASARVDYIMQSAYSMGKTLSKSIQG